MQWDYFIFRTVSGMEYRIGYLNRSGDARETNWVFDKWQRVKRFPQSFKDEDWRETCVWTSDICIYLGDVESIRHSGFESLEDAEKRRKAEKAASLEQDDLVVLSAAKCHRKRHPQHTINPAAAATASRLLDMLEQKQ